MRAFVPFILSIFLVSGSCDKKENNVQADLYEKEPVAFPITGIMLPEVSGIADSKNNGGHLWAHEDSGQPPVIHLFSHQGAFVKTFSLTNAVNRDWEELAIGPGPKAGTNYLYIGEIGDNQHQYPTYHLYRFPEPVLTDSEVNDLEIIRFKYPDGSHDSEAFFIDQKSKDIYIITKREVKGRVYKLSYPQNTNSVNEAEFVLELPYSGVVGCSLSADGSRLFIKTYPAVTYYRIEQNETIAQALSKGGTELVHKVEAQGEAIAAGNQNQGYFTYSEKGFGPDPVLHFYKRLN